MDIIEENTKLKSRVDKLTKSVEFAYKLLNNIEEIKRYTDEKGDGTIEFVFKKDETFFSTL